MTARKQQPSLDGVYDKIRRAKRHRDDLAELLRPFDVLESHAIVGEVRANGYKHIYRWDNPPPLDPDIDLIFGDAIHNLRSALDHLAYQLVVLNKQVPNTTTSFPIFDAPPGHRVCGQCGHRTARPFINPGVSADAVRLLDEVQPYQRTNDGKQTTIGWRLSQLRDLDNIDKHRHLIVTMSAVHMMATGGWTGDEPEGGFPNARWSAKRPVHGEIAAIVHWPKSRQQLDPYLDFKTLVSLDRRVGRSSPGDPSADSWGRSRTSLRTTS